MDMEENLIQIPTAAELGIKPDNGGEMPGDDQEALEAVIKATMHPVDCMRCRIRNACITSGWNLLGCPGFKERENRMWWVRAMPGYAEAQEPRFHSVREEGADVNEPDGPVKSLRDNFFMV